MRDYNDYMKEAPVQCEPMLRDILAELKELDGRIEGISEWIADLDIRLAKLEEAAR